MTFLCSLFSWSPGVPDVPLLGQGLIGLPGPPGSELWPVTGDGWWTVCRSEGSHFHPGVFSHQCSAFQSTLPGWPVDSNVWNSGPPVSLHFRVTVRGWTPQLAHDGYIGWGSRWGVRAVCYCSVTQPLRTDTPLFRSMGKRPFQPHRNVQARVRTFLPEDKVIGYRIQQKNLDYLQKPVQQSLSQCFCLLCKSSSENHGGHSQVRGTQSCSDVLSPELWPSRRSSPQCVPLVTDCYSSWFN